MAGTRLWRIPPEEELLSDERARTAKQVLESTPTEQVPASPTGASSVTRSRQANGAPSPQNGDPLAEDVELSVELRTQLLAMENPDIDHYTLLGVARSAEKKEIKRAYYELAAKFHPDKHFRKRLGSFKTRLETFFSRLTIAHEALGNAAARAEYDAYLGVQHQSRQMEELLAKAASDAERARADIERQVRSEDTPSSGQPLAAQPSSAAKPNTPSPAVSASARRDAFARRLLGGKASIPPVAPAASPISAEPPKMRSTDAMDALRRRYEERLNMAKSAEARKFAARAEQALLGGQIIEAANSFRIASGLAPTDANLTEKARDSQARADALIAETYCRQAEYEEKGNNWTAAARSWVRVCETRPYDVHAHDRGATALIKAGGDLHQAARLAQRACQLEPTTPGTRLTLANVYFAANMKQNARRELETAAKLGANEGTIEAMLKRLEPPT